MSRETHIVGFRVGRETYGVPITSLHEIVRVPEITAVPDAPDYLEGVINLRGKIVSVVDLRKRFGQPSAGLDRRSRILVVEHRGRLAGMIVDSASEVLKIPEERNRSRARHDAGRRIGLRDRPRQVQGTADHSAGYRQGIRWRVRLANEASAVKRQKSCRQPAVARRTGTEPRAPRPESSQKTEPT